MWSFKCCYCLLNFTFLFAGNAELEWSCPACRDVSAVFPPADQSLHDDDPSIPAVESTRLSSSGFASPAEKRPAVDDLQPSKRLRDLLTITTSSTPSNDRTYVIADRRQDEAPVPTQEIDDVQPADANFNLGYSGISSASSPNHSAPDISAVGDIIVPDAPPYVQEEELDLSQLQLPTNVEVGQLPDLTFEVVPAASARMNPKLVDSHNHHYNIKRKSKQSVTWQCSIRNKDVYCKATVKQTGDLFEKGTQPHSCTPKAATLPATQVRAQIAKDALSHPFQSASNIVNQALLAHLPNDAPTDALPKIDTLIRQTNKRRQGTRPANPTTLDFDIQHDAIPDGFLQEDIRVGSRRHLLFFTPLMLMLLTTAKEWYLDATFKSVGAPFTQLWGIHAFIKQGNSMKQVPLVHVLMSGKSEEDYTAVLRHLQKHFNTAPAVTTVMMDFEAAVWNAVRTVFPQVQLRGCAFHWSQALWRHIQDVGLAKAYMANGLTHKFIRRLFSLPYLPACNYKY